MASKILGRCVCPLNCGHQAAHVKIKTDKANGREAFPYAYCPACGVMVHTKTEQQAAALAALTRAEVAAPPPVPVHTPTPTGKPDSVAEPEPVPPPVRKPAAGSWLMPILGGGQR